METVRTNAVCSDHTQPHGRPQTHPQDPRTEPHVLEEGSLPVPYVLLLSSIAYRDLINVIDEALAFCNNWLFAISVEHQALFVLPIGLYVFLLRMSGLSSLICLLLRAHTLPHTLPSSVPTFTKQGHCVDHFANRQLLAVQISDAPVDGMGANRSGASTTSTPSPSYTVGSRKHRHGVRESSEKVMDAP